MDKGGMGGWMDGWMDGGGGKWWLLLSEIAKGGELEAKFKSSTLLYFQSFAGHCILRRSSPGSSSQNLNSHASLSPGRSSASCTTTQVCNFLTASCVPRLPAADRLPKRRGLEEADPWIVQSQPNPPMIHVELVDQIWTMTMQAARRRVKETESTLRPTTPRLVAASYFHRLQQRL